MKLTKPQKTHRPISLTAFLNGEYELPANDIIKPFFMADMSPDPLGIVRARYRWAGYVLMPSGIVLAKDWEPVWREAMAQQGDNPGS